MAGLSRPPNKNTAFHEAGHIVAAVRLELPITEVSTEVKLDRRNGNTYGHVAHPPLVMFDGFHDGRKRRRIISGMIITLYAGYEAELRFDPKAKKANAREDYDQAWKLPREHGCIPRDCAYVGDEFYDAYLDRLRVQARRLVKAEWKAIEGMARAILTPKTVTGQKVEHFVRGLLSR